MTAALLAVMLNSCAVVDVFRPKEYEVHYAFRETDTEIIPISPELPEDSLVMSMIRPYQVELGVRMGRVIGMTDSDLSNKAPNGGLGDLAADILRRTASERLGFPVDIGLTNWGGLRIPISKGQITVGDIFSVMPFENRLVVLTFNGDQIQQLANALATTGGEPISGLRMRIDGEVATDVLVGTRPIKAEDEYTLVTTDFMADGGSNYEILGQALKRQNLDILMRDAMIRYITDRYNIVPATDGRLR